MQCLLAGRTDNFCNHSTNMRDSDRYIVITAPTGAYEYSMDGAHSRPQQHLLGVAPGLHNSPTDPKQINFVSSATTTHR